MSKLESIVPPLELCKQIPAISAVGLSWSIRKK